MAAKKFKVKLEGKYSLESPVIRLAEINIDISSADGGAIWTGEALIPDREDGLTIYLSCKAISDTEWSFSLSDADTGKKIYSTEGYTGEKLESRGGIRIANFSERKLSIDL
jgi:hypothetical protein